jgi:hypothetical protein
MQLSIDINLVPRLRIFGCLELCSTSLFVFIMWCTFKLKYKLHLIFAPEKGCHIQRMWSTKWWLISTLIWSVTWKVAIFIKGYYWNMITAPRSRRIIYIITLLSEKWREGQCVWLIRKFFKQQQNIITDFGLFYYKIKKFY